MDLLRDAARRDPLAPALREGARRWSWADLDRQGQRLAAGLRAWGAGPDRTVATLLANTAHGVLCALTVPRTGAVLAPLSPRLTVAEVERALAALRPSVLVCDGGSEALARDAASGEGAPAVARVETLAGRSTSVPPGAAAAAPIASVETGNRPPEPGHTADTVRAATGAWAVLWTSGTSGRPRGVALSAAALAASAMASQRRLDLASTDRWYAALGLAHVGGMALVHRAAAVGASIVCAPRFDAEEFNARIDVGDVTHASLVPTMLRQVLDLRGDRPFPATFRCLLVGGAHTPRPLLDRALDLGVPVALTYGMTESCSQAATAPPDLVRRKRGTVGEPLDGVRVVVAEDGEILVGGATLALGYVGVEEPLLDGEGWLHTGDLGEMDDEGHLWVTGRRAERIVTGGVSVDPAEVEDVLRLHEDVEDTAVVGVPDEHWGEIVGAAVVRRAGAYPDPGDLEHLARERLTNAKIPRRWAFVEAVPRNANGKVARDAVRALLTERAAPGAPGAEA